MAKYDGLRDYLRLQSGAEFSLTFGEIEKQIGRPCRKVLNVLNGGRT